MKILFAASEAVPFCKTGGLGDVAGALAEALKGQGHDVRLVLPKYRALAVTAADLKPLPQNLRVPVAGRIEDVKVWRGSFGDEIPAYFIDAPAYFDRAGLYRAEDGADYPDNDRRFILFSRAALELCQALRWSPDVIHAHDWQAGLVPAYLATLYRETPTLKATASVFSIHNIAYQGLFPKETLSAAGFGWEYFTPEALEYYNQVNFMKAGLVYADILSTVSPTYVTEVQSGEEFGRGMEGLLRHRSRDFHGVLNGIDLKTWDPAADPLLAEPFSAKKIAGRTVCKADLQAAAGLDPSPRAPLLGMVSRLDPQKGFDILLDLIEEFVDAGAQCVFLGQGNAVYQSALKTLARKYPGRVAASSDFNEKLAHKIYGGSDIFMMPSRFEPCGLGQMISLRYGAVPVVMPTGGLKDTVKPVSADGKSGWGYVAARTDTAGYRKALGAAVAAYRGDLALWKNIMKRGMALDFGWTASVARYVDLYNLARAKRGAAAAPAAQAKGKSPAKRARSPKTQQGPTTP